jgi:hypothetical protein
MKKLSVRSGQRESSAHQGRKPLILLGVAKTPQGGGQFMGRMNDKSSAPLFLRPGARRRHRDFHSGDDANVSEAAAEGSKTGVPDRLDSLIRYACEMKRARRDGRALRWK